MRRPQFSLKSLLCLMAIVGWCIVTLPFWAGRCRQAYNEAYSEWDRPRREAAEKAELEHYIKLKYGSREEYEKEKAAFRVRLRAELIERIRQQKEEAEASSPHQ